LKKKICKKCFQFKKVRHTNEENKNKIGNKVQEIKEKEIKE
jgi:hypothetical protein